MLSCHYISDGGFAASIAEMTFGNEIGCSAMIEGNLETHKVLFSETGGFILEIDKKHTPKVKDIFDQYGLKAYLIGETGGKNIQLNDSIDIEVTRARHRWENGLREKLYETA
jgi:phosphoribosylformylglycinamidine synthase